ncbi:hypothetical protein UFOVP898_8 [uncultured Caudovirales phage]|uniref:Uncharacterized protein n=1 Tax=uncultured Caudovirales phage TaxID=2100421 RepID=A0A6J5SAT7_9CAUD|nr:hypothetical protein UFOVP898_8 [uncultured Caudovirales phage]CAB4176687.1 hypothetical protein UFOVP985_51 [uncultured Caudovirales phage]CAB4181023.1 hypothetical protein UFOVP1073_6 [uncultured Caudovirales phage]CAB4198021.1 hypothetical protein UFOVP1308_45 [uncultured Caudovirales phage]CAB4210509.1 hypothetical protein UFOVP1423_24 [uncultured Caudovirales phage]
MDPRHIGDGVYVSRNADGSAEIAVNHHENKVVFLEPEVIKRLVDYFGGGLTAKQSETVRECRNNYVAQEIAFLERNEPKHPWLKVWRERLSELDKILAHSTTPVEKSTSGFLTREERDAIEAAKGAHGYWTTDTEQEEVLDGLLDRDSKNPPTIEEATHGLERWLGERPRSRSIVINAESRFGELDSNDTTPLPGRDEVSFVLRERLIGGQLVFFRTTVSVSEFGDGVKASDAVVQFALLSMDKFLFDKAADKAKTKGEG